MTPTPKTPDGPGGYVIGPDVDLDVEDVRRADGSRLTETDARELAEEALAPHYIDRDG